MSINRKFLLITYVWDDDLRTIGPLYIYANAKKHNIDVQLLYINVAKELNVDALRDYLQENNFGVIGIGLKTMNYYYSIRLTEEIKKILPSAFIFWGGVHPTCVPEDCLQYVDCIVIGEGEKVDIEIVNHYEDIEVLSTLDGIGIKGKDGSMILNRAGFIEDIEELPYPYYEFGKDQYILDSKTICVRKLSLEDYKTYSRHGGDGYCLITSRSCPNNCSYCINSFYNKLYKDRGKNRFFRRRSVKSTIEEIKYAMENIPTVEFINFMDDHFLVNDEWLKEFVDRYGKEIAKPFIIRGTPESITEHRIRELKKVGLQTVQIGIQSGAAETHKEIFHRAFNKEKVLEATHILHKENIQGMYDFIIGNEFETVEAKRATIELMMEIPKPYLANVFHIIPFPKTDIIQWYEQHNVTPRLDPYDTSYKELEDDFFTMLATLVSTTDNEKIKFFLENMDVAECQEEVHNRYKKLVESQGVIL